MTLIIRRLGKDGHIPPSIHLVEGSRSHGPQSRIIMAINMKNRRRRQPRSQHLEEQHRMLLAHTQPQASIEIVKPLCAEGFF